MSGRDLRINLVGGADNRSTTAVEEYTLLFTDIDYLDVKVGQMNFYHHNPNVTKDISLNGFLIPAIILKAIKQFNLHVPIKS